MIVDDDTDILSSLKCLLEKNGYKVYTYDNGKDFLRSLYAGKKPSLIILDIMMPTMNGWDIQSKIRSHLRWRTVPIMFLTARASRTAQEMYIKYGVDYVLKPFDINDLLGRIDVILDNRPEFSKTMVTVPCV
jgi:DNA-binding response OmpR family regulator